MCGEMTKPEKSLVQKIECAQRLSAHSIIKQGVWNHPKVLLFSVLDFSSCLE